MEGNSHEELAREFAEIVGRISGKDRLSQNDVVNRWFREVPPHLKNYAFDLVEIYRARDEIQILNTGSIVFNNGALEMTNENISVDTGGGDILGTVVGRGGRLEAKHIENVKNQIDSSTKIDESVRTMFRGAVDEVYKHEWDDSVKAEVIDELEKLRKEVEKPTPNESLVKKFWGGITTVAAALPSVVQIGTWLGTQFPGLFG